MMSSSKLLIAIAVVVWSASGQGVLGQESATKVSVTKSTFGKMPDGNRVDLYTLTNANGLEAKVMTFGATLISVKVPDRNGKLDNVTLYLDTLDDYVHGHPLFGSVVGRFANRIAGAKFTIDGTQFPITPNAGKHHIHGGNNGFHKTVWDAKSLREDDSAAVKLSHTSPDGHEGYPGELAVTVVYKLTNKNELLIEYTAKTDKPTHVNLTNHAYWNLAGAGSGDVLEHRLTLHADRYLPADEKKIPLGELRDVKGTVMDFSRSTRIGSRISQVEGENYDHCYVLNKQPGKRMALAARVVEPTSGRVMEVSTTQPGVQLYTARGLNSRLQGGGRPYGPYQGFCLETQHYPDTPNRSNFPSTLLRPGKTLHEVTVFRFSIEP